MQEFFDKLDHPIVFILFVLFAVVALKGLAKWGFTRAGLPGPAALFS